MSDPVLRLAVRDAAAVAEARRCVRDLALGAGFDGTASEELALVASELGSNLVRHGGGGEMEARILRDPDRVGLLIVATDGGPGIRDPEMALQDGFSTAGSLGYGLGTIHRLVDDLEIGPNAAWGRGTRVVCRRWVRRVPPPSRIQVDIGVAARPKTGQSVSGDAFLLRTWGSSALVGVIDGVGHGELAHRAAEAARAYLDGHHDQGLDALFRGVGRVCRGTRGVVMALARLDLPEDPGAWNLTFASVGNIGARLLEVDPLRPGAVVRHAGLPVRRGVLGMADAPSPQVDVRGWSDQHILVLHSDGVPDRWGPQDLLRDPAEGAEAMARRLVGAFSNGTDDATLVVVRRSRRHG